MTKNKNIFFKYYYISALKNTYLLENNIKTILNPVKFLNKNYTY